jgi:hypothetical protein
VFHLVPKAGFYYLSTCSAISFAGRFILAQKLGSWDLWEERLGMDFGEAKSGETGSKADINDATMPNMEWIVYCAFNAH